MNKTNGNDRAFATAEVQNLDGSWTLASEGLTKKEYFAAMAMQGIVGSALDADDLAGLWAKNAVKCAEALITALNESEQK